ncbi:MAG: isochorismate synthase [Balneolales bacterium]
MPDSRNHLFSQEADYFENFYLRSDFNSFIEESSVKAHKSSATNYISLSIPFDNIDPLAVLELMGGKNNFQYYWEHPEKNFAIAAAEKIKMIKVSGKNRFRAIKNKLDDLKKNIFSYSEISHSLCGPHFFGGFSFFDQKLSGAWDAFGNASFVMPGWTLIKDGKFSILTITMGINQAASSLEIKDELHNLYINFKEQLASKLIKGCTLDNKKKRTHLIPIKNTDYRNWEKKILKAVSLIKDNTFEKIVIARQHHVRLAKDVIPARVMHQLRKSYTNCISFIYQLNGESCFMGCTPEKLVSMESSNVRTEGLAGSISRGKTASQDARLEKKLLESQKDLEEHQYVVDSIQDKLKKFSSDIEFPALPEVKKITNVQHLYTPIFASLADPMDPLELVEKLHPTPAVGGFPQESALAHIQELEQFERGWYGGPIGWFNTNGRCEFAVAIRSGLIRKNNIQFFAGCGIVEDSDPNTEWEETKLKLIPMLNAVENGVKI